MVKSAVVSYRGALKAIGHFATQACPEKGDEMQMQLAALADAVADMPHPEALASTHAAVESHIRKYGESALEYSRRKAAEVRELMMVAARTAESLGERDRRYTREFREFSGRLSAIAGLEDLTRMRTSLIESAAELKSCVDRMAQENQSTVSQLRAEVAIYQQRLEESQRQASVDSLTGLHNRRKIEQHLALRLEQARPFTVMIFDVNGFKQINDTYGHVAGDDLLKQFAAELKAASASSDMVGRWGGDEFIVVLEGAMADVQTQAARFKEWVCGEYVVSGRKIPVEAAIGMAGWQRGETIRQLLARADAAMYEQKRGR